MYLHKLQEYIHSFICRVFNLKQRLSKKPEARRISFFGEKKSVIMEGSTNTSTLQFIGRYYIVIIY